MNYQIKNEDFVQKELAKYSLPDAKIAELKEKYMTAIVKDPEDSGNYEFCKSAHQEVKGIRVSIEKKRKELKYSSLDFGRKVDEEAKRLTLLISEIEDHLYAQRRVVEAEKERIAKEREEQIRAEEERKKREEEERLEKERKAEEERLEKIRKEQEVKEKELREKEEAIKREQEERERKIKEEQEKIEAEKRKIEEEKQKAEQEKINALYQKRLEIALPFKQFWSTEQYAFGTMSETNFNSVMSDLKERKQAFDDAEKARLAQEEIERIAAEKAEAERQEALKPDMQKINEFANVLMELPVPEVKTNDAYCLLDDAHCQILRIARKLLEAEL